MSSGGTSDSSGVDDDDVDAGGGAEDDLGESGNDGDADGEILVGVVTVTELAVVVFAPAVDEASGVECAGVIGAGGNLDEGFAGKWTAGVDCDREILVGVVADAEAADVVTPPTIGFASGVEGAGVTEAGSNLDEGFAGEDAADIDSDRRILFVSIVVAEGASVAIAPAVDEASGVEGAGVLGADRDLLDGFAGENAAGVDSGGGGSVENVAGAEFAMVVDAPTVSLAGSVEGAAVFGANGNLGDGFAGEGATCNDSDWGGFVERIAVAENAVSTVTPTVDDASVIEGAGVIKAGGNLDEGFAS